jgi:DNA-binding Lrp family transcriptional regulator
MDALDRKILRKLSGDARRPLSRVAQELGVAQTTLHQRVRRMEEHGVITGSRLTIDWEQAGLPVVALISIEVAERGSLQETADRLAEIPEVMSCFAITGEFDLLLVVRAKSSAHLGEILELLRNAGLGRSRTVVVLNTFFEYRMPPIVGDDD